MSLIDAEQRSQATNPLVSFIVQAPAGSGKTEILTQRYLRLLGTVTAPEQIVALTFTRKAASEMRERIILALQQAASNQKAQSPHQQMTLDFATAALHRSTEFNWDLINQPNRLKISTIDALCQSINQAIPLLDQQIAYAQTTDKPKNHYQTAARRCIQFAMDTAEYKESLKILLLHVDNRQDRLIHLFIELLSKRDQWLNPLFQARTQDKADFEQALALIEEHELNRLKQSLPKECADELTQLAREMAVIENQPDSPRYALRDWYEFKQITQEYALALSKLLLTNEGAYRVAFDYRVGLLKSACSKEEFEHLKNASKELLARLDEHNDFLDALIQVSQLPNPEYEKEQWNVLQALFNLLPLLVGHLQLCFSESNEVDFTTISQQALAALGDSENPTDLALYLDNSIHHLLIDEFQDTSINQFELLNKLIQGWGPGDGKTLFLVGDPMQSIYRFRQAEVGLFYKAKKDGIGEVTLKPLELRSNFRSTQTLVDWVNLHFSKLFPKQFDIETGAVSFHPSTNVLKDSEETAVHAYSFKNKTQEAEQLIQILRYELSSRPDQSIAILVRSRTHLVEIIRLLRQNKIAYQGTDIDLLANLMHLRDVWSLTQALLSPGNRLAWLSVLRGPYCALSMQDLHAIATFNKKESIYSALLHLDSIEALSEEGRIRATYFIQVMNTALTQRYQIRLSDWVSGTLKEFHADAILTQSQKEDLEQLWALIDAYEEQGRLPNMSEFIGEFNSLYSKQATPSSIQVMTIHKSKGLEFDTVFLPGLGAQPNRGDNPMLRWLKLPTENQGELLLVSPIHSAYKERCPLYDYLGRLDEEKSAYEAQRVLYVAATRAKSRLYLLNSATKQSKNSFKSLLKHQEFTLVTDESEEEETTLPLPKLMKLPLAHYDLNKAKAKPFLNPITAPLSSGIPRLIGIVTHQMLQWICDHHPKNINEVPWELAAYEFKKLGFDALAQNKSLESVQEQIKQLFDNPRGLWIIKQHEEEQNEYALLIQQEDKLVTRIIDRTFIDKNTRWIIDFKTGKDDALTQKKHVQQLNQYAHCLSSRSPVPIYCGVYYLANGHWIDWIYEPMELLSVDV